MPLYPVHWNRTQVTTEISQIIGFRISSNLQIKGRYDLFFNLVKKLVAKLPQECPLYSSGHAVLISNQLSNFIIEKSNDLMWINNNFHLAEAHSNSKQVLKMKLLKLKKTWQLKILGRVDTAAKLSGLRSQQASLVDAEHRSARNTINFC